jgi:putative solute:sodium symporter small subunit
MRHNARYYRLDQQPSIIALPDFRLNCRCVAVTREDIVAQPETDGSSAHTSGWRALAAWLVVGWLIHGGAATLNGLKWGALPLGFWLAAQGAPLMFAVGAAWITLTRDRQP